MFRGIVVAGSLTASLLAGSAASAVQYVFTLTGSYDATFAIAKTVDPSAFGITSSSYGNVGGNFGGTAGTARITFDTSTQFPALTIAGVQGSPYSFFGPTIVLNSPDRPRFLEGNYYLSGSFGQVLLTVRETEGVPSGTPGDGGGGGSGPGPGGDCCDGPGDGGTGATVPEPATWAMMIGGFAMIGAALRRRRSVETTVAAG